MQGHGQAAPPQQQQDVPFFKKRWFIITQIIVIPAGIALLFVLLFPVVTAIAQLVINRAALGVDVATISAPQNGRCVACLLRICAFF
jgi:hypothetical protein